MNKYEIWLDYWTTNNESKKTKVAITQCKHIGDVFPVLDLPDDMADREAAIYMIDAETGVIIESGGIITNHHNHNN